MDKLGYFPQELDYNLLKLKLDVGWYERVVHAIVVVTIGLVTSRLLLSLYIDYSLLFNI